MWLLVILSIMILFGIGKVINKMSALTDAVAAVETQVQAVGAAIQTEIQQLKDAIASGADTTDAVTRLTAAADGLAGFKAALDSDDAP